MAEFLKAVAALAWPALGFVFLFMFHAEIRDLMRRLSRLRKGKFLGQEIELHEELDELQQAAVRAEAQVASITDAEAQSTAPSPHDESEEILREAARSPKAALLLLAAQLEKRVRELFASTGWGEGKHVRLHEAVEKLRRQGSLPEYVSDTFRLFVDVRNRLVHGHDATDEDILRAIDSGLLLLRSIEAIPAATHVVRAKDITLYADSSCKLPRENVHGVILESMSSGRRNRVSIYPTTKHHFEVGESVSWEWSLDRVWDETWYQTENNECLRAWISSAEFVGRHLRDLK